MSDITAPYLELAKFSGINNVESDPSALKLSELTEAINVFITNNSRLVSRPGYVTTFSDTNIHSLRGIGGMFLFSSGSVLKYREGTTSTPLTTLSTSHKVRYAYDEVGKIFLTNTVDIGYIENKQFHQFTDPDEFGYRPPRAGQELAWHDGMLFVARGDVVEYTQPFYYNAVNPEVNFLPFDGRVGIMSPVDDGIYMSDSKGIYFLNQGEDGNWVRTTVADYPAIAGTAVERGDSLCFKTKDPYTGSYSIWDTVKGKMLGLNGGTVLPLTIDSYHPTVIGSGSAAIVDLKDAQLHISILRS